MPKFTVASPVKFQGERHEIGAEIEMGEKVAKPLLKSGALVPFVAPKKTDKKPGNDTGGGSQ